MATSLQSQIQQLRDSLTALEAQRALLGDVVLNTALAPIREKITALQAELAAESAPASDERRLVTILFTDIVGSTALAEKLDPEEWRQTVARLHQLVGNIIAQHQGYVAQYLGDGLLALFGAQSSGEYDPENAIRAALQFQSAIAAAFQSAPVPVQIRVGIHTGPVVVGELGADAHKEFTATGDAMNLAARLQSAAPPAGILISHDTYSYVRGVFDVTPQPPLAVKGKTEPVKAYLVRHAKPRAFRVAARGVSGIRTRTVGRDPEIKQLQSAYLDAYENKRILWAQLVGEAGVGKTRLLQEIDDWIELRPETVRVFQARAFAGEQNKPFALIRRMWFDRFQIADDAPLARAETLWVERFRELTAIADPEPAHALGLLVGLPFEHSPYIGGVRHDPAQVKGRALVVSRQALCAIRATTPIQMMLEDLQWADASSLDYLEQLVATPDAADGEPPTDSQGWFILSSSREPLNLARATDSDHCLQVLQIQLQPLTSEQTRELAGELFQNVSDVPANVIDEIVDRSEGIPYFAEEMVNYFVDRGIIDKSVEPWRFLVGRLRESPLPATLQHLLLTRLSVLSDAERAALQRGSIFGRHFWTGGVRALGAPQTEEVLAHLQPRGFVEAQPESSFDGEREWSFHQALLRDVTYESVLKRDRAILHKKAAEWLEAQARTAGRLDEFAGLLGDHSERAGSLQAAAEWFVRAGERAYEQGAPREAKQFFDRALQLLPPVERESRWRALLGREAALDRLGERDAQQADITALLELADSLQDDSRRAAALFRQMDFFAKRADLPAILAAAEPALEAARRVGILSLQARTLGAIVVANTRLGNINIASDLVPAALSTARACADPNALIRTLGNVALHYGETGDLARSAQLELEAAALAREIGDREAEASVLGNLGYDYAQMGLYKMARPILEQHLRLTESIGDRRMHGYSLQNLAWTYLQSGDGRTAQKLLEQALEELGRVGDIYGRAACILYLGFISEQAGNAAGAERHFSEAREGFRQMSSPVAVVETTASLARCALAQGNLQSARERVTEVWTHLSAHGPHGMELPALCYQTCADIFDALGDTATSRAAVQAGYRELMARAEKISDPGWHRSYLNNVPEHRAIIDMWERINATPS